MDLSSPGLIFHQDKNDRTKLKKEEKIDYCQAELKKVDMAKLRNWVKSNK